MKLARTILGRTVFGLGLLASTLLMACDGDEPFDSPTEVGVHQDTIKGGYADDTDRSVIGIANVSNGGISLCSGSLISPNVVLTAQHCVAPSGNGSVNCSATSFGSAYPASNFYVTTDNRIAQQSDFYRVAEVIIPPGDGFCGRDVAIMILDGSVPSSDTSPLVPRVDEEIQPNEYYSAIGFGQTDDNQQSPSGRRYRRDDLYTQCNGSSCGTPAIFPEEWLGDTGICQGDSGGPSIDGFNRVTGVVSRGGAGCTTPIYASTAAWGTWIRETTWYAAEKYGLDVPAWAKGWPTDPRFWPSIGAACTQPSDCPWDLCNAGICTRMCNDNAPCDPGYNCEGGLCAAAPPPPPPPPPEDDGTSSVRVGDCSVSNATGARDSGPPAWTLALAAAVAGLATRRRG